MTSVWGGGGYLEFGSQQVGGVGSTLVIAPKDIFTDHIFAEEDGRSHKRIVLQEIQMADYLINILI